MPAAARAAGASAHCKIERRRDGGDAGQRGERPFGPPPIDQEACSESGHKRPKRNMREGLDRGAQIEADVTAEWRPKCLGRARPYGMGEKRQGKELNGEEYQSQPGNRDDRTHDMQPMSLLARGDVADRHQSSDRGEDELDAHPPFRANQRAERSGNEEDDEEDRSGEHQLTQNEENGEKRMSEISLTDVGLFSL